MYGVFIEKGPADWQILQKDTNCKANIHMSGSYILNTDDLRENPEVWVRVLLEDDSSIVSPWKKAETGDGKWEINIIAVPAGGLYRIETGYKYKEDALNFGTLIHGEARFHVGIGDVYVIAGQSNGAGFGREPVYDPPCPGIHLLKNSLKWDMASHPMNDSTKTAHPVNQEGPNTGHSPWLAFARTLKRALGYPIGLVQASLGGSPLEEWSPAQRGRLYASMLETISILPGGVFGLLWYQGCSDANEERAGDYLERFEYFVKALRSDLGRPGLPLLTVQLNRQESGQDDCPEDADAPWWGMVREAQRQAALRDAAIIVVPSCDSPVGDIIHNTSQANITLGERLARAALYKVYGRGAPHLPPDVTRVEKTASDKILLTFGGSGLLLTCHNKAELPVTVRDDKGVNELKGYTVHNNSIALELCRPLLGRAFVSMGWRRNIGGTMPKDQSTFMPALCFYSLEADEQA